LILKYWIFILTNLIHLARDDFPFRVAGTLLGLSITRDANGKVTAITDSAAPLRNASYSYTDAGRLQSASGTWGADSYSWDANDNRTRADRTVSGSTASDIATLAPGTNRLAELKDGAGVVSRSFTYAPGGDLASVTRAGAPPLAYTYDARGRLSSVTSGTTQIASYAYDWREQRVAASSTEVGSRHYLYAEDGQLLAEHDAATGALKQSVTGSSNQITAVGREPHSIRSLRHFSNAFSRFLSVSSARAAARH
jgi:YD repeat-containing protein